MSTLTDQEHPEIRSSADLLTQKDYARRRGWSKQYVNQLVRQGRIELVNGRIDPTTADAALAGTRDPSRSARLQTTSEASAGSRSRHGPTPVTAGEGTFVKARTVREHFRAMREKMEFEAATGELLRRRDVEDDAHAVGVLFREHMMRAADRIATQIAAHFDTGFQETRTLVVDGITLALTQLANEIRGNEWGFDTGLEQDGVAAKQSADRSNVST